MKKLLKKIAIFLLNFAVKVIVGANVFGEIQRIVAEAEKQSGLSGEQKKQFVENEIQKLGVNVRKSAMNLAVETAVNSMKALENNF